MATAPNPAEKLCSKCEKQPPAGKHAWCKDCKAAYQREYVGSVEERVEERIGRVRWREGVQALRARLVREFAARPSGLVSCSEVAQYLQGYPEPAYEPTTNEPA